MLSINKFKLPDLVSKKINAYPTPSAVIQKLETTISHIQKSKKVRLQKSLKGGTSAFLLEGLTEDNQEIIVKIPLYQIDLGIDFKNEIKALEKVNGRGYVKLLRYDKELEVAFLERLGKPLGDCGLSIKHQIEIICNTLKQSWIPLEEQDQFPNTLEIIDWFITHINESWRALNRPFSSELLAVTNSFIAQRKKDYHPQKTCLVHGDAHNYNMLQAKIGQHTSFKFIDPDGIKSEPAYDLGVIMREWADELVVNPKDKLVERLIFLHQLTGVAKIPIWQWGLIQCVATGLVLLQSDQKEEGEKLIAIAECWKAVRVKL